MKEENGSDGAESKWREDAPSEAARQAGSRSPQFEHGRRNGVKSCIAWLHAEAAQMNDPHARSVLNNAAFHMGVRFKTDSACAVQTPTSGTITIPVSELEHLRSKLSLHNEKLPSPNTEGRP